MIVTLTEERDLVPDILLNGTSSLAVMSLSTAPPLPTSHVGPAGFVTMFEEFAQKKLEKLPSPVVKSNAVPLLTVADDPEK